MKSLVIYYSLDGNTKLLSETIASKIGAETIAIKPKNDIKSKGFMKYFWGGRQVIMKEEPELESLDKDLNSYDLIIIGTPVWAGTYVPAIRSFLSTKPLAGKRVACFCSHGGGPGKTLANLESSLSDSQIAGTEAFFGPLLRDKETALDKAKAWAESLIA
jgi:flavodoxin